MDIFFYSPCRPVSYRYLLCGDIYRFYRNPTLKEIHSFIGKGEVLIKHYDIWPWLTTRCVPNYFSTKLNYCSMVLKYKPFYLLYMVSKEMRHAPCVFYVQFVVKFILIFFHKSEVEVQKKSKINLTIN